MTQEVTVWQQTTQHSSGVPSCPSRQNQLNSPLAAQLTEVNRQRLQLAAVSITLVIYCPLFCLEYESNRYPFLLTAPLTATNIVYAIMYLHFILTFNLFIPSCFLYFTPPIYLFLYYSLSLALSSTCLCVLCYIYVSSINCNSSQQARTIHILPWVQCLSV